MMGSSMEVGCQLLVVAAFVAVAMEVYCPLRALASAVALVLCTLPSVARLELSSASSCLERRQHPFRDALVQVLS